MNRVTWWQPCLNHCNIVIEGRGAMRYRGFDAPAFKSVLYKAWVHLVQQSLVYFSTACISRCVHLRKNSTTYLDIYESACCSGNPNIVNFGAANKLNFSRHDFRQQSLQTDGADTQSPAQAHGFESRAQAETTLPKYDAFLIFVFFFT